MDGESPRYNGGPKGFSAGSSRVAYADSREVHLEIDTDSARSSVDSRDLAGTSGKATSVQGYPRKLTAASGSDVTLATGSPSPGPPSTEPSPAPNDPSANFAGDQGINYNHFPALCLISIA